MSTRRATRLTRLGEQFATTMQEEGYQIDLAPAMALIRLRAEEISAHVGITYAHVMRHYIDEQSVTAMARNTARDLRETGITRL